MSCYPTQTRPGRSLLQKLHEELAHPGGDRFLVRRQSVVAILPEAELYLRVTDVLSEEQAIRVWNHFVCRPVESQCGCANQPRGLPDGSGLALPQVHFRVRHQPTDSEIASSRFVATRQKKSVIPRGIAVITQSAGR